MQVFHDFASYCQRNEIKTNIWINDNFPVYGKIGKSSIEHHSI